MQAIPREFQRRPGALANLALDGNAPLVQTHDGLHNSQPQPGSMRIAGACSIHPIKSVKDLSQVLLTDPASCVRDADLDLSAVSFDRHSNPATRRRMLERIRNQVTDRTESLNRIPGLRPAAVPPLRLVPRQNPSCSPGDRCASRSRSLSRPR
jgi:hypothetical protein